MSYPYYDWNFYLSYGEERHYEKNSTIYYQGEQGIGFYYLIKGRVVNRYLSENGKERFINYISPGMLFGEESSNGNTYLSTATTDVPSIMYYFSDLALLELCKDHQQASATFISYQIYNFRKKLQLIQYLDSNIEIQMKFYLAQQGSDSLYIPINQTSMADDLGTSRATVNKVIRKWRSEGVIELSNQTLHILNKKWFYREIT